LLVLEVNTTIIAQRNALPKPLDIALDIYSVNTEENAPYLAARMKEVRKMACTPVR
jgi:hypothetical protein